MPFQHFSCGNRRHVTFTDIHYNWKLAIEAHGTGKQCFRAVNSDMLTEETS